MHNQFSAAFAIVFLALSATALAQDPGAGAHPPGADAAHRDTRAEDRTRHGAHADGGHAGSGSVRQDVRHLGHSIHQGTRETGHAIHQGLRQTGHAIHEGVKATGHAIHQGFDELTGK